jgi:gamma-glutamyl-gamma-aminobutyrate hydrolase PuuD
MAKRKLFTAGRYFNAHEPFADLFAEVEIVFLATDPEDMGLDRIGKDDVILFGGGADISPTLYGQKPNRYTGAGNVLSGRDKAEKILFEHAQKVGAKSLGICRGAQLVCALSGGSLIQHVTNHGNSAGHDMKTNDGQIIHVCSVHHQMMNPFNTEHELIGWAKDNISTCYLVENDKQVEVKVEPEVVWFPKTQALGIQYHPEFMSVSDPAVLYSRELVRKYLL